MSDPAPRVTIARDPADRVAAAEPVTWAIGDLREALRERGVASELVDAATVASAVPAAPDDSVCIVAAGTEAAAAREIAEASGVALPTEAESLALLPGQVGGRQVLLAAGP